MFNNIRRKFFAFVSRRCTLCVALLLLAGVAFPLAFVDGLAATIGAYTASQITGIFLLTVSTVSLVFSTFADWFLRITLSPEFISIPYTPGGEDGGNAFVFYGWSIVRDFVNMFFILILIIIGLSTSLQIETYRWQKTLPRLVAVALLVNFTPVILGVFIDGANIMMRYFTASVATESVFVIRMRGLFDIMAGNLADTPWTSFTGAVITPIAMTVIFTIFNLITGITYAFYGALFAMRYVAIWLLVIISPFGFFCYILPATQPFFRRWWRWFIGWCIAGVAGAFFLYLGEVMFQLLGEDAMDAMMPTSTEHHGMEIGMFIQAFPLMIPLLFILFGFFVTLVISSLGSKGLIEVFQKASGAAKKTTAQLPGSSFKEKTESAGAAVKSAFTPGPSATSPISSSSKDKPSFRQATREPSLHRREKGITTESTTGGIAGGTRPITEIASGAGEGTEAATTEIAAEFGENIIESTSYIESSSLEEKTKGDSSHSQLPSLEKEIKKQTTTSHQETEESSDKGTFSAKSDSKNVKRSVKKCASCGSSISKDASICPLCKRNTLSSK